MSDPLDPCRSTSFISTEIKYVQHWTEEERQNCCLTVWIDSNYMKAAVCPVSAPRKAIYLDSFDAGNSREVFTHFNRLSGSLATEGCRVVFATMSFAGPVSQDHVVVTNWRCEARERVIHFSTLPFDLFPLDRRRFMNDLEAASYGLIARMNSAALPKLFVPLWNKEKAVISLSKSSLVLSIGSGFGVSFICQTDSLWYNCVISSEAGHGQAYSCPKSDEMFALETSFIKFVSQRLYGGIHQPEWEDFCSFKGLELCYEFLNEPRKGSTKVPPKADYDQIRELAKHGDELAIKAFKIHYRFILRAAQSLVLCIPCERVFIISEAQVKNDRIVQGLSAELYRTFTAHSRCGWLKNIDVFSQRKSSMFPLSGGLFLSRVFATIMQNQAAGN